MAVIPFYPGFKVEILVNDAPLPEYDDIDDTPSPPNSVTKYIEATTGVEFKIRFIINEAFPFPPGHLIASFYFDGEWRRSLLIRSERFYSEIGHTCDSTIAKVEGKVFKQALSFHELQIKEEAEPRLDEGVLSALRKLGSIRVKFQFVKTLRLEPDQSREVVDMIPASFSETVLKERALTHQICFKQPLFMGPATDSNQIWSGTPIGEAPFAFFKFRYRSIDALRALQIVPPLPPLEERPEEDLTIAELQELVKKLKRDAAERALQKVPDAKPEQDDQDSEGEEEDDLVLVEQKKRKRHSVCTATYLTRILLCALDPVSGCHLPALVTSNFCGLPYAAINPSHKDTMAVHDDYPGITVQVIADGQPLKEYEPKDKEEPPKAITRYVESISGVEFAINTTFTPPFD
ncbi:hypothetical protein PTNB85_06478 [Pyrenophora teres f. teres]|nr:hypothetical protein PTNB85_06478 [Pyrenophora teres f. teres]